MIVKTSICIWRIKFSLFIALSLIVSLSMRWKECLVDNLHRKKKKSSLSYSHEFWIPHMWLFFVIIKFCKHAAHVCILCHTGKNFIDVYCHIQSTLIIKIIFTLLIQTWLDDIYQELIEKNSQIFYQLNSLDWMSLSLFFFSIHRPSLVTNLWILLYC